MVAVVTPSDLNSSQFSLGGEVANSITLSQGYLAKRGSGPPTVAPAAAESPLYIDESVTPNVGYHWNGATWNALGGGGGGGGADGNDFITGGTLAGTTLTLTGTGAAGAAIDLSGLAGGGGGSDGVVSAVALVGTNLQFTGTGGGFNGNVDLSSLGGSGAVNSVTGGTLVTVGGTAADPVVNVDTTALCADTAFRECVLNIGLELFNQSGSDLQIADGTDGSGNPTFTPCTGTALDLATLVDNALAAALPVALTAALADRLKQGTFSVNFLSGGSSGTVSFASAFPAGVVPAVMLTDRANRDGGDSDDEELWVTGVTNTGFSWASRGDGPTITVSYLAAVGG